MTTLEADILNYLIAHPEAGDTAEGTVEWWLLEQRIRRTMAEVKTALTELTNQGKVLAQTGRDGRTYYRLNPQTPKEVARHRQRPPE
jgi:hypothetical protein